MLNHEQLKELKEHGHTSIHPPHRGRASILFQLREKYLVEEKVVYHSAIWIIREKA